MNTNEIREKLKTVRCFMLDMDGTIYLGDSLFPFTKDFLDAVVKSGREFCFFTNNSSKDTDTYLQKLSRMGIEIPREKMLISNGVAADYVLENHPGAKVFVLGTPLLRRELTNFGVNVVEDDPDVVLVGFDTTLEYNRLAKACDFIRAGLPTYGLNPDYNCPTETGFIPDCGSIAMLIEGSTGRTFPVFGKPSPLTRAYIAKQTGKDVSELPYNVLTSDELRNEFGQATFFTATDGNHGRGVAWAANKLGQKSVVLMPKGSTQTRLNNILKEGAKATIEEENYDECVRMANAMAEKTENGVMVQDTAWDGYEEIPAWIMQGYGTMANEADDQLHEAGCERPTHVFIQAGVGSLAGAVQGFFANR